MFKNNDIKDCCITIIVSIIAMIARVFFQAFIAYWLWGKIVIPYFNAPELSYWELWGLKILINCFVPFKTSSYFKKIKVVI